MFNVFQPTDRPHSRQTLTRKKNWRDFVIGYYLSNDVEKIAKKCLFCFRIVLILDEFLKCIKSSDEE